MSETNEFEINTSFLNSRSRRNPTRRPLPPGQTRHVYDDDPTPVDNDEDYAADNSEEAVLSDESDHASENQQVRKTTARKLRTRRNRDAETEESPRLIRFLLDRRVSVWLGIFFILLGVAILIVLLSFLKNGALNQATLLNLTPAEIAAAGIKVKGSVGPLGAWFGQVLFAESFGVGAFVFAAYFTILGLNLVGEKKFNFWELTMRCVLLAISLSIVIGLITFAVSSSTFWGGTHGHYVNKWLLTMTGIPGALIVSLLLIGTVAVLYLEQITRFVRRSRTAVAERRETFRRKRNYEVDTVNEESPGITPADIQASSTHPTLSDETSQPDSLKSPLEDEDNRSIESVKPEMEVNPDAEKVEQEENVKQEEPGFEIDVPVSEKVKKTGSVAERLVSEHGEIDPRAELSRYKFPTLNMLVDKEVKTTVDEEEQQSNKDRIIRTLGNYGITIASIKATVGPTVTLYEIVPTEGIRIAQIKRLEDDIAMSLAAKGIRIIAPMPGKGTVGIEVPSREPQMVTMRSILASKKFRESTAKLPIALGVTISNEVFVADLAAMPHALVAGATGQGKSVGLNALIASLLYRKHPSELKFVLIDPKKVEFSVYERLRGHYLASLPGEEDAIVTDTAKVLNVLNSLCVEMDNRYALLRNAQVNKIEDYNRKYCQRKLSADKGHRYLPYIVVIVDEFADLIMTGGKEIEMPVMRITQLARAVGIHMVIATQRPSTNVLTGLIKANCPSRIAFRVQQNVDSRTILDRPGAERLIGRGDMLFSQGGEMERMQCAFISTEEIEKICDSIDSQAGFEEPYRLPEPSADNTVAFGGKGSGSLPGGGMDRDPLFDDAARFITLSTTASTSSLQRRFEIGYNRAGKIMDQMEAAGIVGPASGSKPRSVLVDPVALERILANR